MKLGNTHILLLVLLILLYKYRLTIMTNLVIFLTVRRGIVTTNCTWWNISQLLTSDLTGVQTYYQLKGKIVPMRIMGRVIHIVRDVGFIQQMLEGSPYPFGVGSFKEDFFQGLMPLNVGVSQGCPWKRRRRFNEVVLDTNHIPQFLPEYRQWIRQYFEEKLPLKYTEFTSMGQHLTTRIVFGLNRIEPSLFQFLDETNSFYHMIFGSSPGRSRVTQKYYDFVVGQMGDPKPNSLLSLMPEGLSHEEVLNQIPHWIFPMMGILANLLPRLLLLVSHDPTLLERATLRQCITELLRLGNPVNSTFRGLLEDYQFDTDHIYPKGTQFLIINNPVLRDPNTFPEPNSFRPERWSSELEASPYNLTFNHGPQMCPGKEFSINLLTVATEEYLRRVRRFVKYEPVLDLADIPQLINQCRIHFSVEYI